jgi:hypothetical protein
MSPLRPLAVVMVADPTPLTLTNLSRLATWCDLLLTEGTTTTRGEERAPLRAGWRELLGLEPPRLRVLTTDLGGRNTWERQGTQRNSAIAVVAQEPPDRHVLFLDADELLDADAVQELMAERDAAHADGVPDPVRLGLVPLYGAVDRVAQRIHCCWKADWPDLRATPPEKPYVFGGGSLAYAGAVEARAPSHIRFRSPMVSRSRVFGWHITMAESGERVAWKLANMRHVWEERVLRGGHLDTMLGAGVHHAGWWVADYREPEPWLVELAAAADLRVAGPPAPASHLRALRAWAEARLDPMVPEAFVTTGDAYVAGRAWDAVDFLGALDTWLLGRAVEHSGHVPGDDAGPDAHGEVDP